MATKTVSEATKAPPQTKTVEQWASEMGTKPYIVAGLMTYKGWKTGKCIARTEYENAIAAFLRSAADWRK